jgi:hypothetical protein
LSGFFVFAPQIRNTEGASIVTEKNEGTRSVARTSPPSSRGFSLDTWSVIVALVLSGAIWIGLIKHVPW